LGVRGASRENHSSRLEEKHQAADEFSPNFWGVVIAGLHETTVPVAAEGLRDVVVFHCVTSSTHPGIAEGGVRADTHADMGRILECLGLQP
jgi:hypothetical protein